MKKKTLWIVIACAVLACAALAVALTGRNAGSGTYANLIVNGTFEQADKDGLPSGWYADAYVSTVGYTTYSLGEGFIGGAAHIVNNAPNDARFAQRVSVSPDTLYRLRGFIRADAQSGRGANLSVEGVTAFSESMYSTDGNWIEVSLYGRTGANQTEVTVFARLGGYSGEATGEAWFDDVSLNRVDSVPEGYEETQWYAMSKASASDSSSPLPTAALWLVLASAAYVSAFLYALSFMRREKPLAPGVKNADMRLFAVLAAAALALRVILALSVHGYDIDVGDFIGWANAMAESGPADFYLRGGFSDYPPGAMLLLWLLGGIGKITGGVSVFLVKTPSILCDLVILWLIFSEGKKRLSPAAALALAALYAFSPLALTAGAAWGQMDSVMTLLLLLTVLFALRGQWIYALPVYTLAVLVKPQALMFGPLGLLALVMQFIESRGDRDALRRLLRDALFGLAGALAVACAVVIPFSVRQGGVGWLFDLYRKTMTQYNCATVNGCNLYFALGLNWADAATNASLRDVLAVLYAFALPVGVYYYDKITRRGVRIALIAAFGAALIPLMPLSFIRELTDIGLFSYNALGTAVIAASLGLCGWLYIRGKSIRHLPLLGAVFLTMLFTLGTMMHERYLFPAAALLLIAYALEKDKRILTFALLVVLGSFLNVGCVLDRNIRIGGAAGHLTAPMFGIESDLSTLESLSALINIISCAFGVYLSLSLCRENAKVRALEPVKTKAPSSGASPTPRGELAALDGEMSAGAEETASRRMTKRDTLVMLALTAVYAVVAFVNLGSLKAPQTYWVSTSPDETVAFDLGESKTFEMLYYGGIHWTDARFSIEVSEDGKTWTHPDSDTPYPAQMTYGDLYKWIYVVHASVYGDTASYTNAPRVFTARYVRLTAGAIGLTLYEVVFRDPDTKTAFEAVSVTDSLGNDDARLLADESGALEGEPGWFNGMYFDEIYHARTGYEHLHGLRTYETTHPPLGKVFISWCIGIFGMTPFGWRFAGTLAGVMMLPAVYLIARRLFRRRWLAPLALSLFLLDTMHFTQTRIATIDSFGTLFILWSVYFMFRWLTMDFFGEKLWKTFVPLGLSGLFMGLAIASKWTGCYAGAGLAVLFFWGLYRRFMCCRRAKKWLAEDKTPARKPKSAPADPAYSPRLMTAASEGEKRLLLNTLSCFLFFVFVPLVIYYLSYIPYFAYQGGVTVKKVIDAAESMLAYHAEPGRGMDHFFYAPWYLWPIDLKPMWYSSTAFAPEGFGATILAFGNPIVWWTGLAGILGTFGVWIKRHIRHGGITLRQTTSDIRPALLLITFAAQYLPWALVPRGTYIYHYFPSVPFIILSTALCLDLLSEKREKAARIAAIVLVSLAGAAFIGFFPYASGVTVPTWWLDAMKWFPDWLYY